MRSTLFIVTILGSALVGMAAAPKEQNLTGVLAPLKKGETVSLKDVAGRYEISFMPGIELSHKVVEVGPDFVVVEDIAAFTQTRIPVYSIRAVTVTRVPMK